MERMDAVLQRVQSSSTKRAKSPAVLLKQKTVWDDSESYQGVEELPDSDENTETTSQNDNTSEMKKENKKHAHEASEELTRDTDEAKDEFKKDTVKTSFLNEESPDSLYLELPSSSGTFASWWRWFLG